MAIDSYDFQVCLRKILKLSCDACVTFSIKHPYVSFTLLCLFILYMFFPLAFWVLIYSFPLGVCIGIILSISLRKKGKESNGKHSKRTKLAVDDFVVGKDKEPFTRVHSVRRRRAKELKREDDMPHNVEEKSSISSPNSSLDIVDKNALTEESPKEIHEVKAGNSLVNRGKISSSAFQAFRQQIIEGYDMKVEETPRDQEDEASQVNEGDQKNVMDVGIESNKRLENLIARRRSRKLLSLHVRRTLMNVDRNDHQGQLPSLIIPKPSNVSNPFSPGPGSAPSVLMPMRNPFDLPYDPQEEKPDLTGDNFQQEFMPGSNKDAMFCRHESFSLGAFLPGTLNQNREEAPLVHDAGFRQRNSSQKCQFSRPRNKFGGEISPVIEQESFEEPKSESTIDGLDDHIKEIIHENPSQGRIEEDTDEVQTRPTTPVPGEDFAASPSSPSSSSEEDEPVLKIDREAILKSLSSMARRNGIEEVENSEETEEQLNNDDACPFNSARYYDHKTIRHHTTYSIASDLQVEVSEVSSPPLVIDENFSYNDGAYDGKMEKEMFRDSEALWTCSTPTQVHEDGEEDRIEVWSKSEDASLSDSMELDEKHCVQQSMQLPSNAELLYDSGQADAAMQTSVGSVTLPEGSLDN